MVTVSMKLQQEPLDCIADASVMARRELGTGAIR